MGFREKKSTPLSPSTETDFSENFSDVSTIQMRLRKKRLSSLLRQSSVLQPCSEEWALGGTPQKQGDHLSSLECTCESWLLGALI